MLLPLNLKTSKSVALSIIKIDQFYSIKPCTIVNGFGMDEIDSSFILTKAENENFFLLLLYLISMRNLIQLEKIYSFVLKKY
jgi:hypothetical protein